jgi:hypothetical protein
VGQQLEIPARRFCERRCRLLGFQFALVG